MIGSVLKKQNLLLHCFCYWHFKLSAHLFLEYIVDEFDYKLDVLTANHDQSPAWIKVLKTLIN